MNKYYAEVSSNKEIPTYEFETDEKAIEFFLKFYSCVIAVIKDNDPEITVIWEKN